MVISKFFPEEDSIGVYLERASLYFVTNGIDEDKRVLILLSSIGAQIYSLLHACLHLMYLVHYHSVEFLKFSLRISSHDTW